MTNVKDYESLGPLPENWKSVALKEVVSKLVDGSHNPPRKKESGFPMLSARNIENNQIVFDKFRFISEDDFEKEHARTRVEPGDVLLTIVGTIGRVAVVPATLKVFTLQRSVAVLTPNDILPKYLMYQLQAPFIQMHFIKNARGTAQKGVYLKTLGQTPLRVAPLKQQKRIVAEIEKQFSRLDEAVANLKRVKANLKRYKAAVLKAAVEGKLTEDLPCRQAGWRDSSFRNISDKRVPEKSPTLPAGRNAYFAYVLECDDGSLYKGFSQDLYTRINLHLAGRGAKWTKEHKPVALIHFEEFPSEKEAVEREKYFKTGSGREWINELRNQQKKKHEPASILLERILTERRRKWEQAELAKMKAKGEEPKNDKWKKKCKEPVRPDSNDLPILPSGWVWASLEAATDAIGGFAFKSKEFTENGYQIVKMANIKMGKLDLSQRPSFIEKVPEVIIEKYQIVEKDILMTLTGTRKKRDYGYVVQIKNPVNSLLLNQRIARLRPYILDTSGFVSLALQSETFRELFFVHETGNVGQGNVGMKAVTTEPIPLPPLDEQDEIIKEYDRVLSVIIKTECAVETSMRRAERLRQSILSRAFSGSLIFPSQ